MIIFAIQKTASPWTDETETKSITIHNLNKKDFYHPINALYYFKMVHARRLIAILNKINTAWKPNLFIKSNFNVLSNLGLRRR